MVGVRGRGALALGGHHSPPRSKERATMVTQGQLEKRLAAFEESHGPIAFPEVWMDQAASLPAGATSQALGVQIPGLPEVWMDQADSPACRGCF